MDEFKVLTKPGVSILPAMTKMTAGQFLQSPSKQYKLMMQPDCNLVLLDGVTEIWVANSNQAYSTHYRFKKRSGQPEATMAYYFRVNQPCMKQAWGTIGYSSLGNDYNAAKHRAYLSLQDDGNIVVIDRQPLWAHNKSLWTFSSIPVGQLFDSGFQMRPGQSFTSGGARLEFREDGNLIALNSAGSVTWSTETAGRGVDRAVMQDDGNFVVYAADTSVWSTNTAGHIGAFAQLQENGCFSVAEYKAVWARFGVAQKKRRKNKLFGPFDIPVLKVVDFVKGQ
ncbi:hypothetical protein [Pseudomonas typographi]|uniref:hypothetical protein n=1 Tax=Pseudomonas typographi TaxID=2715964 RepID=UPI001686ED53|nr:hypothetical protein [Pseudomonas typographi]MBD1589021.1 hypothetical protein [Pseudomonas typographi]